MKKKPEIYISVDIETDGPVPILNSMLSLGAAAFLPDRTMVSTFEANFDLFPGAKPNPATMTWWGTQKDAWEACRQNLQDPKAAITGFVDWVNGLGGTPVFVAYPVTFDFSFPYAYMVHYGLESPFSFSGLDLKTYAMAKLGTPYRDSTKRRMPKEWHTHSPRKHSHVALDDAIEQGHLFISMLQHK